MFFFSTICVIYILHKFLSFLEMSSNICTSSHAISRSFNQSLRIHIIARHSCKQINHRHNIKGNKKNPSHYISTQTHMLPYTYHYLLLHISISLFHSHSSKYLATIQQQCNMPPSHCYQHVP